MSDGRTCNKAYKEKDCEGRVNPCFFVYNGICWKPKDLKIPCPIPNESRKKGGTK